MKTTIDILAAAKAEKNYTLAKAEVRLEYSDTETEHWSAYGTIRKDRVVNGTLGRKTTKQIVTYGWERISKADAVEILGKYGLTTKQFAYMRNEEVEASNFNVWAKNGCSAEFLLEIGSIDETTAEEYRAYLKSIGDSAQETETAPANQTKIYYAVRRYGYVEAEERYYTIGLDEIFDDLGEAVQFALADRDSRSMKIDKHGYPYENENYGGATVTRYVNGESDTVVLDSLRDGDIETDNAEVQAILDGSREVKVSYMVIRYDATQIALDSTTFDNLKDAVYFAIDDRDERAEYSPLTAELETNKLLNKVTRYRDGKRFVELQVFTNGDWQAQREVTDLILGRIEDDLAETHVENTAPTIETPEPEAKMTDAEFRANVMAIDADPVQDMYDELHEIERTIHNLELDADNCKERLHESCGNDEEAEAALIGIEEQLKFAEQELAGVEARIAKHIASEQPKVEPEPTVYFEVHGTAYGHYDSETFTDLQNYLFSVNKSGKKHNDIRLEHYEGTDVEEYCGSENFDASAYDLANCFHGTVTPWTLHQIQNYDGEDGIKLEVTTLMKFDC